MPRCQTAVCKKKAVWWVGGIAMCTNHKEYYKNDFSSSSPIKIKQRKPARQIRCYDCAKPLTTDAQRHLGFCNKKCKTNYKKHMKGGRR